MYTNIGKIYELSKSKHQKQPTYLKKVEPLSKKIGDTIFINGKSNQNTNLKIFFNDGGCLILSITEKHRPFA